MPSLFARARRMSETPVHKPEDVHNSPRKSIDGGPPSAFHAASKIKTLLSKKSHSTISTADSPSTPERPNGHASTPTTPQSPLNRYPSPTSASRNRRSSLSQTLSPEGDPSARTATSWQPSYPTVVPDDSYADIAPDGHTVPNGMTSPRSPILPNENAHRRSLEDRLRNGTMDGPEASNFQGSMQVLTPDKALPTPPSTAAVQKPTKIDIPALTSPASEDPSTPAKTPRPRPGMPMRRSTLISSPPMPQPIKNLPTLVGLLEGGAIGSQAKDGVPRTPLWTGGNVPRTPGWGGLMSPRTPATPGGGGFPWSLPSVSAPANNKSRDMSEDELRRAKRAMVSHLSDTLVLICVAVAAARTIRHIATPR